MKNNFRFILFQAVLLVTLTFVLSYAGVPLNNLEGVGGIAFNPLAYLAGNSFHEDSQPQNAKFFLEDIFSKPQFGGWYVNLDHVSVDWTTFGVAGNLFKRLELSYGYETVAPNAKNIHKNNVGAKLLLLKENYGDLKFIPALSVGSVWKHTSLDTPVGIDTSDFDYYLVATKLITQLPKPVLLSAGVISTKGRVLGVYGFDKDRKENFFANIDILPFKNIAVGFEYKQGAKFKNFKNADYWDAHLAWFANKNLSLVAAYVNAGDSKSSSKVGLGDGIVLSAHYAF
jgi:hypothetical protein